MAENFRIFLSSTSKDLEEYRESVYKSISKMNGFECVRMEDFGACKDSPLEKCRNALIGCDVMVGIAGVLYGSAPPETEISFTELEYDTAVSNNIDKLMFVTSNDFPVPQLLRENDDKCEKQKRFRERVLTEHVIDRAETPDKLATNVVTALHNHFSRANLLLDAPDDRYVIVIEDNVRTTINIVDITKSKSTNLFSHGKPKIINKITFVSTSTKEIFEFDFSSGTLPPNTQFNRFTTAYYQIIDHPSERIAEVNEPRFIKLSNHETGLLIEPSATNHIEKSAFSGRQTVFLNQGVYSAYFEGSSTVTLRGLINADVPANHVFTFHVPENASQPLVLHSTEHIDHFQLEEGEFITSIIPTKSAATTRIKDEITITISDHNSTENGKLKMSVV